MTNEKDEFDSDQIYNAAEREIDIYRNEISKLKEEIRAFKSKQEAKLEAKPTQLDEAKMRDSIADKIHEVLHGWFWSKKQKRVDIDVLREDIYNAIIPYLEHNLSLKSLAQKPTAPASLIEEVKGYANKQYEAKNGLWSPKLESDLIGMADRYEGRKEVALTDGLMDTCGYIPIMFPKLIGKRGRIIFIEDKEPK